MIDALRCYDEKEISLDLVKALLRYICTMGDGAILVFLPGWDTISKLNDMLKSDPVFRSQQKYLIIPLHSMMPTAFQQQVLCRDGLQRDSFPSFCTCIKDKEWKYSGGGCGGGDTNICDYRDNTHVAHSYLGVSVGMLLQRKFWNFRRSESASKALVGNFWADL